VIVLENVTLPASTSRAWGTGTLNMLNLEMGGRVARSSRLRDCVLVGRLAAAAATLLTFAMSTPAWAECSRQDQLLIRDSMKEVQQVMDLESERSEKFRTGNKPAFKAILDARAKSGKSNKNNDDQLAAEMTRRMTAVHDGTPKQVAAIQMLKTSLPGALERKDCAAALQAIKEWLSTARARIAEYDDYFKYLDSLAK
jgi:hypothetical protein